MLHIRLSTAVEHRVQWLYDNGESIIADWLPLPHVIALRPLKKEDFLSLPLVKATYYTMLTYPDIRDTRDNSRQTLETNFHPKYAFKASPFPQFYYLSLTDTKRSHLYFQNPQTS